jgi:aminoglycoside phosphotransferase (APT) family kinase protein
VTFRLGNLIVDEDGLAAVLELVHLGDPVEDLGWPCTKAWRFGAALPVGGFATRDELLDAYTAAGDAPIGLEALLWWEVLATLKWAIGCMGQGSVHLAGRGPLGRAGRHRPPGLRAGVGPAPAARPRVRSQPPRRCRGPLD